MKRMMIVGLLLAAAGISGCIAVGGSDRIEAREPTIGRQLQDLKVARDTGAMTAEEYDRTRQAILASVEHR
ncbi:MAG TPA: hypothetical protein PLD59_07075 [Tepidisphaeraceae bacterium]|nr:hypothetical protein [Tepidisphaeraceae bacterium]